MRVPDLRSLEEVRSKSAESEKPLVVLFTRRSPLAVKARNLLVRASEARELEGFDFALVHLTKSTRRELIQEGGAPIKLFLFQLWLDRELVAQSDSIYNLEDLMGWLRENSRPFSS